MYPFSNRVRSNVMKTIHNVLLMLSMITILLWSCGRNESGDETGTIDQAAADFVPIEAYVVSTQSLSKTIELTGKLQPMHQVDIVAETGGQVIAVNGRLGESVIPRDTLARIDDEIPGSQLEQARAQALSAKTNLQIAKLNLDSDRQLYESNDISRLAFENSQLAVDNARANYKSALAGLRRARDTFFNTRITSPIPGLISRKYIEKGAMVSAGQPVYRVVDMQTMKITVGVPQDAVSRVRVGNEARVLISALSDTTFTGTVRYMSPQADAQTGTFAAEIHLPNTARRTIRAGMTARVRLLIEQQGPRLVIPEYAILPEGEQHKVYAIRDGRAFSRFINLGEQADRRAVVTAGLSLGDTIAAVGIKNLKDSSRVYIEQVVNTPE
ncbi:MAG: efflux RND transporter periplasmic adaptor subunit [Caldithrix sp.]|nr:efflux RND transporter periplasmic adaptor subunit [Caldithrix sp.]